MDEEICEDRSICYGVSTITDSLRWPEYQVTILRAQGLFKTEVQIYAHIGRGVG